MPTSSGDLNEIAQNLRRLARHGVGVAPRPNGAVDTPSNQLRDLSVQLDAAMSGLTGATSQTRAETVTISESVTVVLRTARLRINVNDSKTVSESVTRA